MLFKAIYHGKEHRKPYSNKGLRRFGHYCLCDFDHSPKRWQDPWCRDERLYNNKRREDAAKDRIRSFFNGTEEETPLP